MSTANYCVSYGTYYSYLKKREAKLFNPYPIPEVDVTIKKFNNGEISVIFNESLRGKHIFIFGEISHHLDELLMTLDAAKRCSVSEITVVLPYYGYSRQDKREGTRGCIGSKVMAHVIESMPIDRVISIDLHASQIQAYFQCPFEHLSGINIFKSVLKDEIKDDDSYLFVTPDAGGTLRTLKFASVFGGRGIATINKRRDKPGEIASMELTGNVKDKVVILIDDIADSCKTLCKASDLLLDHGAAKTYALATHPVLSGYWYENVGNSSLTKLILSDTLNVHRSLELMDEDYRFNEKYEVEEKIQIVTCMDLLEEAIDKIAHDKAISHLN